MQSALRTGFRILKNEQNKFDFNMIIKIDFTVIRRRQQAERALNRDKPSMNFAFCCEYISKDAFYYWWSQSVSSLYDMAVAFENVSWSFLLRSIGASQINTGHAKAYPAPLSILCRGWLFTKRLEHDIWPPFLSMFQCIFVSAHMADGMACSQSVWMREREERDRKGEKQTDRQSVKGEK